jgi:Tfp pilus assembly protein PilE
MENKKKKIAIITTSVIILAVICAVGGYAVYKQNEIKERSVEVKAEIVENWKRFEKEEERNKKLEIFNKNDILFLLI